MFDQYTRTIWSADLGCKKFGATAINASKISAVSEIPKKVFCNFYEKSIEILAIALFPNGTLAPKLQNLLFHNNI